MPGLLLGYSVIWGILAIYILTLGLRIRALNKKLKNDGEGNGKAGS